MFCAQPQCTLAQNLDNVIKNLDMCTLKFFTSVHCVCNRDVYKSFSLCSRHVKMFFLLVSYTCIWWVLKPKISHSTLLLKMEEVTFGLELNDDMLRSFITPYVELCQSNIVICVNA